MKLQYEIEELFPKELEYMGSQDSFVIIENFIPYTSMQLLKSGYFKGDLEPFSLLFEKYCMESDMQSDDNCNDDVCPETSSILLDMLFVMNKALFHEDYYIYISKLMYIKLREYNEFFNIYEDSKFLEIYLAIYTYLLEINMNEIKQDLSALYCLRNSDENETAKFFFDIIVNKYSLTIDSSKSLKDSFNYIQTTIISNQLKINVWDFRRFVELLQAYKPGKIDFLNRTNCFCLVHENSDYFFSISGYAPDKKGRYAKLAKDLEKNLKAYPTFNNIQYCSLSDDMLSYSYEDNNKHFKPFSNPIKYIDSNKNDKEIAKLYSCCERKIIPFLTHSSNKVVFYCKYEPCCLCIPAIENEKQYYDILRFFAFAKGPKQFHKYINKNKKILLKEYTDFRFTTLK